MSVYVSLCILSFELYSLPLFTAYTHTQQHTQTHQPKTKTNTPAEQTSGHTDTLINKNTHAQRGYP